MSDATTHTPPGEGREPEAVSEEAAVSEAPSETEAETAPPVYSHPDSPTEISDEAVVALIAERDEYLEALQRLKAEFANARRRSDERAVTQRQQAAADLVERLLPVLDSCDAAIGQGIQEIRPISDALLEVLTSRGLRRVDPVGEAFDPQQHEAVLHEEGEGTQIVAEVLRPGYTWNEKVLRPAMVKVQG